MVPTTTAPASYASTAAPIAPAGETHPLAALPANDNGQFVNNWIGNLDESQRATFDQLATTTHMPPDALARALAAHGAMEARFPGSTGGQEMPNYNDVYGFYSQMPADYQSALRDFQGWQMQSMGEGLGGTHRPGRVSGQLISGQDFRPQNWILHPQSDVAVDPNRLLNPDRYENMRGLADLHGVDVTSPGFQQFWRQWQQRWADPAQRPAGGVPQLLEMYRGQNAQRQDRQQATADTTQPLIGAQRFFGMRRTDPGTGQEFTVANPHGRQRLGVMDHIGGIGGTVGAGFMAAPAAGYDLGSTLETGTPDTSASRMTARSLLDYPNRLLGTDIGHNVESRPLRFREGQPMANADIGPDAGRGAFGSRVVSSPSGSVVQHGAAPAFGEEFARRRLDPATGAMGRLGYGTLEHLANNAETYAGLAGGAGLARGTAGALATQAPLASRIAGGTANGADTFRRFHGPVITATGQAVRAMPTGSDSTVGNHLDDMATQGTLDLAQPGASLPQRAWAGARRSLAGLVPGAPAMAGASLAPRNIGRNLGGNLGLGLAQGVGMDLLAPPKAPTPAQQTEMRGTIGTGTAERLRRERQQRFGLQQ